MSGFKDIMKHGWHPDKTSGGSIRGSVSGLMGRNKDSSSDSSCHIARPLSDLKDAASFAPPPRRTGVGLSSAPPPAPAKRKVVASPSKYMDPRADSTESPAGNMSTEIIEAPLLSRNEGQQTLKPCHGNTATLSAQKIPKPPVRRDGPDSKSPPPYSEASRTAPRALPPSLPPRLPPRGTADTRMGNKDGNGNGLLNEGAVNRLGTAGISVPGLGIGRGESANSSSLNLSPAAAQPSVSGSQSGKWGSQVNELQGRFVKMKTPSTAASAQEVPAQGTTWAQKQAALKTASNFHKDPSSVSLSDAKAAATTANNFRQRHGEQVASGVKAANSLNQKYRLIDKVGAYAGGQPASTQSQSSPPQLPGPGSFYTSVTSNVDSNALPEAAAKKKPPPPPPPPKKKAGLTAASINSGATKDDEAPPPIPMSTRPIL